MEFDPKNRSHREALRQAALKFREEKGSIATLRLLDYVDDLETAVDLLKDAQ